MNGDREMVSVLTLEIGSASMKSREGLVPDRGEAPSSP